LDRAAPDTGRPDSRVADGAALDSALADLAPLDQAAPDQAAPDQAAPDQTAPDMTVPDQAIPDMPAPDMPVPDMPAPDQAIPDQLVPDMPAPDQAIPDMPAPDQAIPDQLMPDLMAPDLTLPPVKHVVAFPKLSFIKPLALLSPRDGTGRLFVLEQIGKVHVFPNNPSVATTKEFLNIKSKVDATKNEMGLLGMAVHPQFKSNGLFYLNYTASGPRRTVIGRFKVSAADKDKADLTSFKSILELIQPAGNHNGGWLDFGPDKMLYIGFGDGGGGGDPFGHGQNLKTLLGAMLRIDVINPPAGKTYGIPATNPYAKNTQGYREEIYAHGLRNPWRCAFDPITGALWCGDVGAGKWEEIDIIKPGANYGWNKLEGNNCFPHGSTCSKAGFEPPVHEYFHVQGGGGRSVTGGYVYRGKKRPDLLGAYIYADFISGEIWKLKEDSSGKFVNTKLLDTQLFITSFGEDAARELYFTAFDGKIYAIQ